MKTTCIIPNTNFLCHFSDHLEPKTEVTLNQFVDDSPATSSMQRSTWTHLVHLNRVQRFAYLWCEEKKSGRFLMAGVARLTQLFPGRYIAVFHRGPVVNKIAHFESLLPGVMMCLRQFGVCTMTVSPFWQDEEAENVQHLLNSHGFTPLDPAEQSLHTTTGLIDLTHSEEEIFSGFSRSCRGDIRRTARKGVVIQSITTETEIRTFRDIHIEMARNRGMDIAGQPDIMKQWQSLRQGKEDGVCLSAKINNQMVGGIIVVREGRRAMPRTLASRPVSIKLPRNSGLMWEAMQRMKRIGCHFYDMGGLDGSDGDEGRKRRYLFKFAFNPKIVHLVPIHMVVLRPASYRLLFGIRQAYHRFPMRRYVARLLRR